MNNLALRLPKKLYEAFELDFLDLVSGQRSAHMGPYLYQDFGETTWAHVGDDKNYYICEDELALIKRITADFDFQASHVLELGPGEMQAVTNKTLPLLQNVNPQLYTAVDLNHSFVTGATETIRKYTSCHIDGVEGDIFEPVSVMPSHRTLVLMHGNTLANMPTPLSGNVRDNLRDFFRNMQNAVGRESKMLLSFDQTTDETALHKAYDTSVGAELIKSILYKAQNSQAATLNADDFSYQGTWHSLDKRYELSLIADCNTQIKTDYNTHKISKGDLLHIANSFRYSVDDLAAAAHSAGWKLCNVWDMNGRTSYAEFAN